MRHQRGDRYAADFLQREIQDDKLCDIGQRGYHPVLRLEAKFEQVQCQVVGDPVELGVGVLPLAVDQGNAVRIALEHYVELLRQRLVAPIALCTVIGCELGRERYKALQHVDSPLCGNVRSKR